MASSLKRTLRFCTKIKAVFFDVGGTLIHPHPSVGGIYARTARDYGCEANPEILERNFKKAFAKRGGLKTMKAHSDERLEKEWWRSLVSDVFKGFGKIKDFDTMFEYLFDLFATAQVWRIYPDVPGALQKLSAQKLVLGAISNWDSRLPRLMQDLGLSQYFAFILNSTRVGAAKPNPRIFHEALRRARCRPEEALHVGDLLNEDYEGARRAGLNALWLRRKESPGKAESDDTVPTLHSLSGLLSWV